MKLVFRVETRKIKQPRIVVLRALEKDGKIIHKALGSFSSKRSYEKVLNQLTTEEFYEFENFVKTLEFSKTNYNCDADKLDRFIIKVAPEFKKALYKIWEKAKEYNINFIPEYEMLLAVFYKAKVIEQQLALFSNGEFKALRALGTDITNIKQPKANLKEEQKLIAATIDHAKSLDKLTELFNNVAAKKYNKTPKFKSHHFEFLAKQTEQGQKQPTPKWYYTVAIDVLCILGIKPDTIIPINTLTANWLRLNKKENLEKTLTAFYAQFPHLNNNQQCKNIIMASLMEDDLEKMCGQQNPIPAIAIVLWLEFWRRQHPDATPESTIKEFNKNFNILIGNRFLLEIINRCFC
jgi:hypothetical protein